MARVSEDDLDLGGIRRAALAPENIAECVLTTRYGAIERAVYKVNAGATPPNNPATLFRNVDGRLKSYRRAGDARSGIVDVPVHVQRRIVVIEDRDPGCSFLRGFRIQNAPDDLSREISKRDPRLDVVDAPDR